MKKTWMAAVLAGVVLLGGCGKEEKQPMMTQPEILETEETQAVVMTEETVSQEIIPEGKQEELVPQVEEISEEELLALQAAMAQEEPEEEEPVQEPVTEEAPAEEPEDLPKKPAEEPETAPEVPEGAAVGKVIKVASVNMRQGPSTNSNIVKRLKKGETVNILEGLVLDGIQWAHVDGGWVCLDYLEVTGTVDLPKGQEEGSLPGVVFNTDTLNLRSEPNGTSEKAGQLKRYEMIPIYETKNGWGRTDGGWVSLQYVHVQKENASLNVIYAK